MILILRCDGCVCIGLDFGESSGFVGFWVGVVFGGLTGWCFDLIWWIDFCLSTCGGLGI